jgi:TolA-binding protein
MKRIERHRLKENDFVESVARARAAVSEHQQEVTWAVSALVVLLVIGGGLLAWRANRNGKATELLAGALAVAEAPVIPPAPPAPGSPAPVQQPGTYRSEHDRLEAALPRLLAAADTYPNTDAGLTARYRAAATLAELGRFPEAEQRFKEVVDRAGRSSIYSRTARLGLGEAQLAEGKTDAAIATFRELATEPDSELPLDGVLMQLGRAAMQGGKRDEASRAFTRIVQEFPQSAYVSEAKQRLDELKKA